MGYFAVGLTVAFSLVGVVLFGTVAGSMLPFLLRRAGLDYHVEVYGHWYSVPSRLMRTR